MASRAHDLVLRDLRARAACKRARALPSALRVSLQLVLQRSGRAVFEARSRAAHAAELRSKRSGAIGRMSTRRCGASSSAPVATSMTATLDVVELGTAPRAATPGAAAHRREAPARTAIRSSLRLSAAKERRRSCGRSRRSPSPGMPYDGGLVEHRVTLRRRLRLRQRIPSPSRSPRSFLAGVPRRDPKRRVPRLHAGRGL